MKKAVQLGMITERKNKSRLPDDFLDMSKMPEGRGVLEALLKEREEDR